MSAWTFGLMLAGLKYVATRSFRFFALPTYNGVPAASIMRYTPGRRGSAATNSLASNVRAISAEPRQCAGLSDDRLEHGRGQPARLSVVAAAMVGIDEMLRVAERMFPAVRERECAAGQAVRLHYRLVRDSAEREYHPHARQR